MEPEPEPEPAADVPVGAAGAAGAAALTLTLAYGDDRASLRAFREVQDRVHCPFARRARMWGSPDPQADVSLEGYALACAESLSEFARVMCSASGRDCEDPESPDGYVLRIAGDQYGHSLAAFADAVRVVLSALSSVDPSGRRAMEEPGARDSTKSWRFSFGSCGMFVSTFAPCYPPTSSRYQFGVSDDSCFVVFQPDIIFDEKQIHGGTNIRSTFARKGQPYEVDNNHIVKPLDEYADPPVQWWETASEAESTGHAAAGTVEFVLQRLGLEHHIPTFRSEAISFEMLGELSAQELEVDLGLSPAECATFVEDRLHGNER